MAVIGLKMVTLGLVTSDFEARKVIKGSDGLSSSGIIKIDDNYLGSKTANMTGLSRTYTSDYVQGDAGDLIINKVYQKMQPQVSLEINNLSYDILNKIIGFTNSNSGGYYPQIDLPRVAMLIELPTLDRKNSVYFGFGQGYFTRPTLNSGTDTNAVNVVDDSLVFYAESTPDFENNMPFKAYYSGSQDFDESKMITEVFPS